MQKRFGKIMTGVGIGMAIGGVGGALGGSMMHAGSSMKPMKKKAAKALQGAEDILDSLRIMLK